MTGYLCSVHRVQEYTPRPGCWTTGITCALSGGGCAAFQACRPDRLRNPQVSPPPTRFVKILDKYVLREHAGPLVFALSALTSLLLLNYIAKQFARLVGKGLPWSVIGEFFMLSLPFVVAMTLPMAVLVSTLYAFSRLSAESEITALKASGVSMPRLMVPVVLASMVLSLVMVWFNDFVLPNANHQLATLQYDIARVKPTFALNEQVINPVSEGRIYLKAGRIPRGSNRMYEVVLYTLDNPNSRRTIHADSGELAFAPNGGDLLMTLYDGAVQELPMGERRGELQRIFFETQLIRVKDVGNQLERSTDRTQKTDREMSICEMQDETRVSVHEHLTRQAELERTLMEITRALALGEPAPPRSEADTVVARQADAPFGLGALYCKAIAWILPGEARAQDPSSGGSASDAAETAARGAATGAQRAEQDTPPVPRVVTASTVASLVESANVRIGHSAQKARQLQVEVEKKFALAAACTVFVLFGAPLALRFPRGGVGLVLGISIVVFALYYVGLIGGESLADRGRVPPFIAMWGANIVFTAIGLVLIARMGREASAARSGDWHEKLDGVRDWFARRRGTAPEPGAAA